jgi:uncharacterized DUF497 family protein
MALEFEWDNAKAKKNLRKHAVSFDEATSAFYDALSVTIPDPDHSAGENRFLLIGKTVGGYIVVVSHTDRGERIRIISARRANRHERANYEES